MQLMSKTFPGKLTRVLQLCMEHVCNNLNSPQMTMSHPYIRDNLPLLFSMVICLKKYTSYSKILLAWLGQALVVATCDDFVVFAQ